MHNVEYPDEIILKNTRRQLDFVNGVEVITFPIIYPFQLVGLQRIAQTKSRQELIKFLNESMFGKFWIDPLRVSGVKIERTGQQTPAKYPMEQIRVVVTIDRIELAVATRFAYGNPITDTEVDRLKGALIQMEAANNDREKLSNINQSQPRANGVVQ